MDRIQAMQAFITVATEGSFSRAAGRLDLSPQLVSKYVSWLEEHLGTRLLNRTTRKVSLTEGGQTYLQRAQQVLTDIEDMENEVNNLQEAARGTLRIAAPVSFAIQHLAPLVADFQQTYPEVAVDLRLNDRKVDILEEGFDIALRIGQLKSSSLIAKRLAPIRLVTCASPDYLATHGTPQHPDELVNHRYLKYSYMDDDTPFSTESTPSALTVSRSLNSGLVANNGDVLVKAAMAGSGIVIQPPFIAGPAIKAGQLVPVLSDYEPQPLGLYAVYAHRRLLSSKVRCFIDFIDGYFGEPPYWDRF